MNPIAIDEDRARWEKNVSFCTQTVDMEDGHRLDLTIRINSKHFIVTVLPTPSPDDPITPLISRYNKSFMDNDEELQKAQDEIEDIIYEAGWRKFALLAPGIERGSSTPPISLLSTLNPETFLFSSGGGSRECPSNLPRYSARDITITEKLMGTGFIARVSAKGQDMCCKVLAPRQVKAVQREYECLKKIADSQYAYSISAPRLIGFVVDDDDDEGAGIGILEEYIPHVMTLGRFLKNKNTEIVAIERRRKWAEQIQRNILLLHGIGVVWGDGKPENVLIHSETDDCYLVDFGGSWTDGWVDAELRETEAGDEQALTRILGFLGQSGLLGVVSEFCSVYQVKSVETDTLFHSSNDLFCKSNVPLTSPAASAPNTNLAGSSFSLKASSPVKADGAMFLGAHVGENGAGVCNYCNY
ncbi:hypothetical protein LHYA1_G007986 [Lachnellula hyalina]|uniref:Protein kinase domain-containing protein n=1 Tax=Lachnellula hyalina TaxID=1316788 RepID=A0A8H8QWD6_9HELO|nr:uncharacterized protein LHYA1_G007986 [Lachnellula hyalina]TVY23331.1 hypothetical protein LHYA1_G007986 [Lachnellula hyalina]